MKHYVMNSKEAYNENNVCHKTPCTDLDIWVMNFDISLKIASHKFHIL